MSGRVGSITTEIITDGLVFNMDAANRASYPRIGVTATDTVGNVNGTLTNGASFIEENNGFFNLDGTDDYISTTGIDINSSYTFSIFIQPTSYNGSNPGIWRSGSSSTGNTFFIFQSSTGRPWIRQNGTDILKPSSGFSLTLNNWVYLTIVIHSGGNNVSFYVNGELKHDNTHSQTISLFTINNLGFQFSESQTVAGKYANTHIYNRALSATEVLHNYDALKGRFGL